MEEGMIEIDPELFMTCRLCIEEKGKFQILPVIQEKIKFCLDIEVNLFDGLSQLICGKCKAIIHEYSNVKETFQAKQAALLMKTKQKSLQIVQETVTSSQSDDKPSQSNIRTTKKKITSNKRTSRVISSSSSSDSECVVQEESLPLSDKDSVEIVEKNYSDDEMSVSNIVNKNWKDLYHRNFVCRYCPMTLSYKRNIRDHVRTHAALLKKKRDIKGKLLNHCVVQLERFDERLNLTGEDNVVVITPNKLLSDEGNGDYYVVYTGDGETTTSAHCEQEESNESSDAETVILHTKRRFTCTDITSSDEDKERPKLRKRIRLMSLDFTEDNNSKDSDDNSNKSHDGATDDDRLESNSEACTIVENSKDEQRKGSEEAGSPFKPAVAAKIIKKGKKKDMSDYKIIHNIATMSLQKFSRKQQSKSLHKKSNRRALEGNEYLNRKVLHFGRKTIFKEGPLSMGLMKYLEQMNLKIHWNQMSSSTGKECVRLLAKLMDKQEVDNMTGFQEVTETAELMQETEAEKLLLNLPVTDKKYKPAKTGGNVLVKSRPNKEVKSKIIVSPTTAQTAPAKMTVGPQFLLPALPMGAYVTNDSSPALDEKTFVAPTTPGYLLNLLNASPVANPKKAPKKKSPGTINESQNNSQAKIIPTFRHSTVDTKSLTPVICIDLDDEAPNASGSADASMPDLAAISIAEMTMPVITSTTSYKNMAEGTVASDNQNSDEVTNNATKAYVPFVFSASETCMPIITATTSLANMDKPTVTVSEENTKSLMEQGNNYPRIKCKPVSELMKNIRGLESQTVSTSQANVSNISNTTAPTGSPLLQGISNTNSTIPPNRSNSIIIQKREHNNSVPANNNLIPASNKMVPGNNSVAPVQQLPQTARAIPQGSVILHTVALPNTITNSPFNYFKQLLSIHSLNLLDCRNPGDSEFVNLAKFRLGVHQSPTSIVLSLHLQAKGLNFRILIFNEDGLNVDLRDMTALWQLEVLKAFHSENVVSKIINSAKKTRIVSESNAILFVSLLKSIQLHSS